MRVLVVYPDRRRDHDFSTLGLTLIRALALGQHVVSARAVGLDADVPDDIDETTGVDVLLWLLPLGLLPSRTRSTVFTLSIQLGPPSTGHTRPVPLHAVLAAESCARRWAVTVYHAHPPSGISLPIWATEIFELAEGITKAELMNTAVPRAAWTAIGSAMHRIEDSVAVSGQRIGPYLRSSTMSINHLSVSHGRQWSGSVHAEVKSSQGESIRTVDPSQHTAGYIARLVRAFDDGVRGALIELVGSTYEAFGAHVETAEATLAVGRAAGSILGQRDGAILIACACETAVWLTHLRPVASSTALLAPKLEAVRTLARAGIDTDDDVRMFDHRGPPYAFVSGGTWQEVVVEFKTFESAVALPALGPLDDPIHHDTSSSSSSAYSDVYLTTAPCTAAFVRFDWRDGFGTAEQIKRLHAAICYATRPRPNEPPVRALVLCGGAHTFAHGIDPHSILADDSARALVALGATTSFGKLINALVDPTKLAASGILTIAALSGPASGSGLALACACDVVLATPTALLDPSYVDSGLSGADLHTLIYPARIGLDRFRRDQRPNTRSPLTGFDAKRAGYVDAVMAKGEMGAFIARLLRQRGHDVVGAPWTRLPAPSGTEYALAGASLVGAMCQSKVRRFGQLSRPYTAWRDEETALLRDELMDDTLMDRFEAACAAIVHNTARADIAVELNLPGCDVVVAATPTTPKGVTRCFTPESTTVGGEDEDVATTAPSTPSSGGPITPTKTITLDDAEDDEEMILNAGTDSSPRRLIDALPLPPPRMPLIPLPPLPTEAVEADAQPPTMTLGKRRSSVGKTLRRALSFHSLKMPKRASK